LILLRMIYFIFLWVSFTALLRLPMTSSWVYKVKDLGTIQFPEAFDRLLGESGARLLKAGLGKLPV